MARVPNWDKWISARDPKQIEYHGREIGAGTCGPWLHSLHVLITGPVQTLGRPWPAGEQLTQLLSSDSSEMTALSPPCGRVRNPTPDSRFKVLLAEGSSDEPLRIVPQTVDRHRGQLSPFQSFTEGNESLRDLPALFELFKRLVPRTLVKAHGPQGISIRKESGDLSIQWKLNRVQNHDPMSATNGNQPIHSCFAETPSRQSLSAASHFFPAARITVGVPIVFPGRSPGRAGTRQ